MTNLKRLPRKVLVKTRYIFWLRWFIKKPLIYLRREWIVLSRIDSLKKLFFRKRLEFAEIEVQSELFFFNIQLVSV